VPRDTEAAALTGEDAARNLLEARRCKSSNPVKKSKERATPFGISLMRSQVVYQAAQGLRGIKGFFKPGPYLSTMHFVGHTRSP